MAVKHGFLGEILLTKVKSTLRMDFPSAFDFPPLFLFFSLNFQNALRALFFKREEQKKNSASLRSLPRCTLAHNILCSLGSLNTNLAVRFVALALPNHLMLTSNLNDFAKFGMLNAIRKPAYR